jgi:class 3 adenylate cyclase
MTRLRSGVPAAGAVNGQDLRGLEFRFLVTIDAEGFSRRPAVEQARVQDGLERAMSRAAADAGLHRERWYRQSRGDGEFAVLPEGTDGLSLVADYPDRLASALVAVNDERKSEPRLRVRMAIHHGAVASGPLGPVGTAPVVIARLVDAEPVRRLLSQRSDLDIALIVSDTVYNEVIQSRLHDLDPETFRRVIVRAKGNTYAGYLRQDLAFDPAGLNR